MALTLIATLSGEPESLSRGSYSGGPEIDWVPDDLVQAGLLTSSHKPLTMADLCAVLVQACEGCTQGFTLMRRRCERLLTGPRPNSSHTTPLNSSHTTPLTPYLMHP